MRKVGCSNIGRDTLEGLKQVETVPLCQTLGDRCGRYGFLEMTLKKTRMSRVGVAHTLMDTEHALQ